MLRPGNCSQLGWDLVRGQKISRPRKTWLAGSPGPRGAKAASSAPGDTERPAPAWGHPTHPSVVPPPLLVHTSCTTPLPKSGGGGIDPPPPFPSTQAPQPRVPPEQHFLRGSCLGRECRSGPRTLGLPGGAAGTTSRWGQPGAPGRSPCRPGSAGRGCRGPEALWTGRRPAGTAGPAAKDGDVSAEPCPGEPVRQPLRKAESPRERFRVLPPASLRPELKPKSWVSSCFSFSCLSRDLPSNRSLSLANVVPLMLTTALVLSLTKAWTLFPIQAMTVSLTEAMILLPTQALRLWIIVMTSAMEHCDDKGHGEL